MYTNVTEIDGKINKNGFYTDYIFIKFNCGSQYMTWTKDSFDHGDGKFTDKKNNITIESYSENGLVKGYQKITKDKYVKHYTVRYNVNIGTAVVYDDDNSIDIFYHIGDHTVGPYIKIDIKQKCITFGLDKIQPNDRYSFYKIKEGKIYEYYNDFKYYKNAKEKLKQIRYKKRISYMYDFYKIIKKELLESSRDIRITDELNSIFKKYDKYTIIK